MAHNFYQLLALLEDYNQFEIQRHRKNVTSFATDSRGIVDLERYRILHNAYSVLSCANLRREYDEHMRKMKIINDASWLSLVPSLFLGLATGISVLDNSSSSISWIGFGLSLFSLAGSAFMISYSSNHVNGTFVPSSALNNDEKLKTYMK